MTGLIPGVARRLGIPTLFTVHNIHTQNLLLTKSRDMYICHQELFSLLNLSIARSTCFT
jgi:hypothetical protein